ncbi:MAG: hypothetical protein F9K09_03590 [Flavobacteriales bacterium]|nr:MAG: hypothetical protein F9K09_03590 [Flavobacteriales bacterium]
MQKISSYIFILLIAFSSLEAHAQATTNSPYSRYGVGILRPESTNQNFALAGTGIATRSFNSINLINPASFSELGITTFEVAATNNSLRMTDGKQNQYQNHPHISYIALGFPVIRNKWGMAFGAKPYSNVGYDYSTITIDPNAGGVSYYYKGEGGLSNLFLGNALKFKIDSTSMISFGHQLSFLFGNIFNDRKVILSGLPSALNFWSTENTHTADFTNSFGVYYQKHFFNSKKERYVLSFGAIYALASELKSKKTETIRTFIGNIDFGSIMDTISYSEDAPTTTQLPSSVGGGLSLEKENKWLIALDVKSTNWGNIKLNETITNYKNNLSISSGFELIPKYDAFNSYFKRVKYRLGVRYSTAYLSINNQDISEYGITFGLGLPLKRTDTSVPSINLGVEYGNRGIASNGLIKETFVNLNFGLTINDRWFIKRKYD